MLQLVILLLWFLSALADYSEYCYLWQMKGYLWKRFRDFLSTRQGKAYWLTYRLLWRSCVAIIVAFWPINNLIVIQYFLLAIFSFDFVHNGYVFIRHRLHRPVPTKTSVALIGVSLLLEGSLFWLTRDWQIFFLLMIVRFGIMSLIIGLLYIPRELQATYLMKRARSVLKRYPKIHIIGITGSYGKTTVKDFLAHLLAKKYRVLKTPENTNTDVGIATFILQSDLSLVDILIIEIGAYRRGHVADVCAFLHPTIGVLTGINEQHLSLFGSIEETQQTKFELLQALPKTGLAIVNSDNTYCRELLPTLSCRVETFGQDSQFSPTSYVGEVAINAQGIFFQNTVGENTFPVTLPLWGDHQAMNVVPGILIGLEMGMSIEDIQNQCATMPGPTHGLRSVSYGNSTVIDDSYSANPDGVVAALKVLDTFSRNRKRIVITRGMVELGSASDRLHEDMGKNIALYADELVVITSDAARALERGVQGQKKIVITRIEDSHALLQYVKRLKQANAVILVENRLPSNVARELQLA